MPNQFCASFKTLELSLSFNRQFCWSNFATSFGTLSAAMFVFFCCEVSELCVVCEAVSTPLKKRRLTADAMSSSCSSTLGEDGSMMDKHLAWSSMDSQFESRQRLLASRNLFEVRFCVFLYRVCIEFFGSLA